MTYFWGYGNMIISGITTFFQKCKEIFCISFSNEEKDLKPDDLFIMNFHDDGTKLYCFIVTKVDEFFAAEYEYNKETGTLRETCYSKLFIRNYN